MSIPSTAWQRMQQQRAQLQGGRSTPHSIERIAIVGGGSAGWIAAATLSEVLGQSVAITLVESEAIGTVGVGEATIPTFQLLVRAMGVDERALLEHTEGTFKLGIEFVNWGRPGNTYFHPFGALGNPFDSEPVHQHWLQHRHLPQVGLLRDYSVAALAASMGRFAMPTHRPDLLSSTFNYAFHLDAGLLAAYLRRVCERRGVVRTEGVIQEVRRHPTTGHVQSLRLHSGAAVDADLYLDCSGFAGVLIGQALGVGYESWSQWLPCDRAVAMPCESTGPPAPFTRSTALEAGWQWTIPLRHRVGNGHVFSSAFTSSDRAVELLRSRLPGRAMAEPRVLSFTPGRRLRMWEGNVVALGLSAGFVEPLESTSLHMLHSGLAMLLAMFPDKTFNPAVQREYNRRQALEMERIRDFLILHYLLNAPETSPMWAYCAHMQPPDILKERLELFRYCGQLQLDQADMFGPESWMAVHLGQLNFPHTHAPLLQLRATESLSRLLSLKRAIHQTVAGMPTHESFLSKYLASPTPSLPTS